MARRQIVAVLMTSVAITAQAAGTAAGTAVSNQARVTYTYGAQPLLVDSNVVTFRVDAVLDVSVAGPAEPLRAPPGGPSLILPFTVTNTGNFTESFEFEVSSHLPGDDFDPAWSSPGIYFDTDGSGGLTTADQPFVAGGAGHPMDPDQTLRLFVVAGVPQTATSLQRGLLRLHARGLTGTGSPGTTFAGRGPNGVDVVAGDGGGAAFAGAILEAAGSSFSLTKSVSSTAPEGRAPQRGAVLTYRLDVMPLGGGDYARIRLRDPVPSGTRYVPGSLRLDDVSLSDAIDGDPGALLQVPAPQIQVDLANAGQVSGSRKVEFSVIVE